MKEESKGELLMQLVQKEDLFQLVSVTNPVFSNDGRRFAFMTTTINEEKNRYEDVLYVSSLDGKEQYRLTQGTEKIAMIQWSPSDTFITFLSSRSGSNQLHALRLTGGEAEQWTSFEQGVDSYFWGNDETTIYLNKNKTDEKKEEHEFPQAVTIERLAYKADGVGLVPERHLKAVFEWDVAEKKATLLIDSDYSVTAEAVSSDGKQLVLAMDQAEDPDRSFDRALYVYNTRTKEQQVLIDGEGAYYGAVFSPDDQQIAFVGATRTFSNATHSELYRYTLATDELTTVTEMMDAPVGDYAISDFLQRASGPAVKWTNANDLYFRMSVDGDVRIYIATSDGAIYPASEEEQYVYGYDVTKDGTTAVIGVSQLDFPGELFILDIATGERQQVTFFNDAYVKKTHLVRAEVIRFESSDEALIHGWLMKPANYEEGKTYPLIVNVHGGPHVMYASTFFHEMQVFAANGFGVLYVNPRGSHSYSQQHVDAVRGNYGTIDYEDIMNAVDFALKDNDWIDEQRLGVTGGSYGGFMTNWIVTHTNRFKAAATQRSISNWISFNGVSDIGHFFSEWQHKVSHDDIEALWDISPLKYVEAVETPLLILHAEEDHRCPIEQGEQLYVALKRHQKQVKFIRFPQSDHNLSRQGLPNLRQTRLQALTDWFITHL